MYHERTHCIRLIAPPDRGENRRVLLPRLCVPTCVVQRRKHRLLQLCPHLFMNADEVAVLRRRDQQRVKLRIQPHELVVHMIVCNVCTASLLHRAQQRECSLPHGLGCLCREPADTVALNSDARRNNLTQIILGHGAHRPAAVCTHLKHPFVHQLHHRLTHGGTRHIQLVCELLLRVDLPRPQLAFDECSLQILIHLILVGYFFQHVCHPPVVCSILVRLKKYNQDKSRKIQQSKKSAAKAPCYSSVLPSRYRRGGRG